MYKSNVHIMQFSYTVLYYIQECIHKRSWYINNLNFIIYKKKLSYDWCSFGGKYVFTSYVYTMRRENLLCEHFWADLVNISEKLQETPHGL